MRKGRGVVENTDGDSPERVTGAAFAADASTGSLPATAIQSFIDTWEPHSCQWAAGPPPPRLHGSGGGAPRPSACRGADGCDALDQAAGRGNRPSVFDHIRGQRNSARHSPRAEHAALLTGGRKERAWGEARSERPGPAGAPGGAAQRSRAKLPVCPWAGVKPKPGQMGRERRGLGSDGPAVDSDPRQAGRSPGPLLRRAQME